MALLLMELKKLIFSKLFVVFGALIIIFGIMNCQQVLNKNLNSSIYQPSNMTVYTNDSKTIMKNANSRLEEEIKSNNFKTYQFGFLKEKSLSSEKVKAIEHLLSRMKSTQNFHTFKIYSNKVAKKIGIGSSYSSKNLHTFGVKNMSKSAFNKEKDIIKNQDLYYGAYSRYFSDIMGVILGILPFFLSAYLTLTDSKYNNYKVINSREISSFKLIFIRLIAVTLVSFLPVLIFSIYFIIGVSIIHGYSIIGILTFYEILFIWLIPIVFVTSMIGMLVTNLINSYLGVIIQFVLWFINLNIGANRIEGNYGYLLIPRHNSLFNAFYFYQNISQIVVNRISYFGIGVLLLLLTTLIFSLKRKGIISSDRLFKNRNKV